MLNNKEEKWKRGECHSKRWAGKTLRLTSSTQNLSVYWKSIRRLVEPPTGECSNQIFSLWMTGLHPLALFLLCSPVSLLDAGAASPENRGLQQLGFLLSVSSLFDLIGMTPLVFWAPWMQSHEWLCVSQSYLFWTTGRQESLVSTGGMKDTLFMGF